MALSQVTYAVIVPSPKLSDSPAIAVTAITDEGEQLANNEEHVFFMPPLKYFCLQRNRGIGTKNSHSPNICARKVPLGKYSNRR